jgi:hypothetical protein
MYEDTNIFKGVSRKEIEISSGDRENHDQASWRKGYKLLGRI